MSTYGDMAKAIGAHFDANVTQALGLPTVWPNQGQIPPGVDLKSTKWLRVTINWQTSRPEIVQGAKGRYRTRGEVVVSVFAPSNSGIGSANETADAIVDAMRGLELGAINFEAAEIRRAGLSGHWWQTNVHCPFYADEVT